MSRSGRELRRTFLRSSEGRVFVAGSYGLIAWLAVIVILWRSGNPWWNNLLIMGFTQLTIGRAGGITYGLAAGMSRLAVAGLAIYLDMLTAFLAYPPLIYSYKYLMSSSVFQRRMKPMFVSAEKSLRRVARFQIVGLFFFVWAPFWMTGVVVGAILGYLMGLATWVNLTTVAAGTSAAILCWVYAQDAFFGWLTSLNPKLGTAAAIGIVLALVLARFVVLWRARRRGGVIH